ncbi:hypothetical protein Tco_0633827 [Tanacetum coccineum]
MIDFMKHDIFKEQQILCDCDKSTKLQQGLDGCSMVQYCSLSRLRLMFSWLRGVTTGNIRVPKSSQQTLIFNARAAAKDSHLLLLPMTICANTAAKDVNKRTAQVRFVCWYDGPQERVLLIGTNNGLYCSFLRSILVLLVVTYGTVVSFAAAYDEYVLLSAKCQENCEFDWLLGARGQFKFVPVVTWTLYHFFYFVPMEEAGYKVKKRTKVQVNHRVQTEELTTSTKQPIKLAILLDLEGVATILVIRLQQRGQQYHYVTREQEMITSQLQGKLWLYDEVRNPAVARAVAVDMCEYAGSKFYNIHMEAILHNKDD